MFRSITFDYQWSLVKADLTSLTALNCTIGKEDIALFIATVPEKLQTSDPNFSQVTVTDIWPRAKRYNIASK